MRLNSVSFVWSGGLLNVEPGSLIPVNSGVTTLKLLNEIYVLYNFFHVEVLLEVRTRCNCTSG